MTNMRLSIQRPLTVVLMAGALAFTTVAADARGGGGGGGGGGTYVEPSARKFQSWQGWKRAAGDGLVVFSWQ